MERRLIAIYLTDHLAGATAGCELAGRAVGSNAGTELGDFLSDLEAELDEDREALLRVMQALEVRRDRVKETIAWSGEKLGRLKLNGQFTGYSPLSRLIELEGLHLGITGKLAMWEALQGAIGRHIGDVDVTEYAERARRQRAALEPFRLSAAREALAEEVTHAG